MRPFTVLSLFVVLTAATGGAQEYLTPPVGGEGGLPFNIACPVGKVLVGIRGSHGSYVDRVELMCVAIDINGNWVGTPTFDGGATGGAGGAPYERKCAVNSAVSTIAGRWSNFVDQLQIGCKQLTSYGKVSGPWTLLPPVGGTTGTPFGPTGYDCGDRPGKGFRGRSYAWLDNVNLVCEHAKLGPALLSPDDKAYYLEATETLAFNWATLPAATKYRLCVSRLALTDYNCTPTSMSTVDTKAYTVTTNSHTLMPAGALPGFFGKILQWRVFALNDAGGGAKSDIRQMRIRYPNAQLVAPAHEATAATRRPIFEWTPVSDVYGYRFRYYNMADPEPIPKDTFIDGATQSRFMPQTELPSGKIFWMINVCQPQYFCGSNGSAAANTARVLTIP